MKLELQLEYWNLMPACLAKDQAGRQLALSEALLQIPAQGSAWWYSASHPALIIGASQKPEVADFFNLSSRGYSLYHRTSGGTAVLAEPSFLSLDVALPTGHPLAPLDIVKTYRWLGETWLGTVKSLGVKEARLVSVEEVREKKRSLPDPVQEEAEKLAGTICFGSLSPFEVAVGNRKLVGLSQIRRKTGILLQCGLPLQPQKSKFSSLLQLSPLQKSRLGPLLEERLASLEEESGRNIPVEEVVACFEKSLQEQQNISFESMDWKPDQLEIAGRLQTEKFFDYTKSRRNFN